MRDFAVKVAMLVAVSALGVVGAACGGDSKDAADPTTATGAGKTVVATTSAKPTEAPPSATKPAAATENISDFDPRTRATVENLCVWAASAVAGSLNADKPFELLLADASLLANSIRAGGFGKTLEPAGKALATAAASKAPADLKAAGTDISAACKALGWTPS